MEFIENEDALLHLM